MKKPHSLVRTLYLYLFSLVGLIMLTIGGVQIVDLALKTYIFPEADSYAMYPERPFFPTKEGQADLTDEEFVIAMKSCEESCELTDGQREALTSWLDDYEKYEQNVQEFPEQSAKQNRQRQAANALAYMIIGAPLFLYHWRTIQRDYKETV